MPSHSKHISDFDRHQLHSTAALQITRFAIVFALTCLVATFVMLLS